jgi:hypothetical protein
LTLSEQVRIITTIWRWNVREPAEKLGSFEGGDQFIELHLPDREGLLGYQIQIVIAQKEAQPFCRTLHVQPA